VTGAEEITARWAVRVPTGYRVGDWEVTEPIATAPRAAPRRTRPPHANSGIGRRLGR
jgi:hypothetical protein